MHVVVPTLKKEVRRKAQIYDFTEVEKPISYSQNWLSLSDWGLKKWQTSSAEETEKKIPILVSTSKVFLLSGSWAPSFSPPSSPEKECSSSSSSRKKPRCSTSTKFFQRTLLSSPSENLPSFSCFFSSPTKKCSLSFPSRHIRHPATTHFEPKERFVSSASSRDQLFRPLLHKKTSEFRSPRSRSPRSRSRSPAPRRRSRSPRRDESRYVFFEILITKTQFSAAAVALVAVPRRRKEERKTKEVSPATNLLLLFSRSRVIEQSK